MNTAESLHQTDHYLRELDEQPVRRFHLRTVLITGMGFFTDAYDLFIIGTVTTILGTVWHIQSSQISLLNSASLLSAALGSLIFGWLMDRYGRRNMYGVEAAILTIGALMSAFAPNFGWLLAARFLLGIGVGGDYPASAVIISEFANRPNRGRLVASVFAMQGLGLVAGPLIAILVLLSGVHEEIAWRLLLGLGAIPAIIAFYLRRRLPETPRFTLHAAAPTSSRAKLRDKIYAKRLLGVAIAWFLVDISFYGNGISSHIIISKIFHGTGILRSTEIQLLLFAITALPGYVLAAWFMDTLGRKTIQWIGFLIMGLLYMSIYIIPGILQTPSLFLAIYGCAYMFIEFGPNVTTFIYPAEVFPTHLRGRGHGIAAASGKLGAFFAAFLFPLTIPRLGLSPVFGILGVASLLGVWVTLQLLPEPKLRALEELNSHLADDRIHETYTRILESIHGESTEETILEELLQVSGADIVSYVEFQKGTILPAKIKTIDYTMQSVVADSLRSLQLSRLDGVTTWERTLAKCIKKNTLETISLVETTSHPTINRFRDQLGMQHAALIPLGTASGVFGVVILWDREQNSFNEERLEKLRIFVRIAAIALSRSQQFQSVREMALTDALTTLPNRAGFEQELEERIQRVAKGVDETFAFAILDLDHFKDLNDRAGHQEGDRALREMSSYLRMSLGRNDVAARLGGDEFIIILARIAGRDEANARLQEIIAKIPWSMWKLGASAGIAFFPAEGETYQDLYRVADARLYRVKRSGGGHILAEDNDA